MVRKIRRGNEPLEHLIRNLRSLRDVSEIHSPEVRHLVVAHVYDLIGMALGANRVDVYGLRAARLNAVKADILENLCSRDLTVRAVASRQHVSPRYIHMLFATEGQTFSEFVLAERLVHAHRMLSDPRHSCKSISAIAFEAGFGDLSYFDRTFRRRFGETPSKVRQGKRALDFHEVQNSAPPPVYPGGGK
jgi:AraC-like DNA-binding protein